LRKERRTLVRWRKEIKRKRPRKEKQEKINKIVSS
jgi:hypothetical protein